MWENVSLAGAFLLGAILATIACLRIVRAVTVLFDGTRHRRRWRRRDDDDPPSLAD